MLRVEGFSTLNQTRFLMVFGAYSRYYNLLYKDKDYAGEAGYVHSLIQRYRTKATSVLDLGCGTGRHDIMLADKGYDVTGVDLSEEMLAVANSQPPSLNSQPSILNFLQGDIRSIRLDKTFDVVISLFHVMSYQTTNEDLAAAFATARAHLNPGGIFIFDCWYGPAVLSDPPVVRVKRLEDDEIEVVRIAEPAMHYNENVVDVNYQVMIISRSSGKTDVLNETHKMRYLFKPEIAGLLSDNGIHLLYAAEWMTEKELGGDSWNGCFVGSSNYGQLP